MSLDFIYDTPNAIVLFIFILVFLSLALIGLFIFTIFTEDGFNKRFNDANTGTFIAVVATALALVIAFVITNEYNTFGTTSLNLAREANSLYTLVGILGSFNTPEAEDAIILVVQYLCSIINVEFLLMKQGILPSENECLINLQLTILLLEPTNDKQTVLFDKALDQLNLALNLRNYRLEQTVMSLPQEFYWLLIIGVSILIVLTWIVTGDLLYRLIMTSFVTIIYATLIVLVTILDLPFRGYFSLTSEPFQLALSQLGVINCPTPDCSLPISIPIITNLKAFKNKKSKFTDDINLF